MATWSGELVLAEQLHRVTHRPSLYNSTTTQLHPPPIQQQLYHKILIHLKLLNSEHGTL